MNELRARAATILRDHFDTEAADAGLKSLNLESTGASGSRSFDGAAVARADRSRERSLHTHRRIREALQKLRPEHVEIVSLAYGVRLRSRDIEDGKKRKALRQHERNWRVRLAEVYGSGGAYVLASPLAKRLFERHLQALQSRADALVPDRDEQLATLRSILRLEEENLPTVARDAVLSHVAHGALDAFMRASEGGIIAWLLDAGRAHSSQIQADANKHLNAALDAFAESYEITIAPSEPRTRSSEPSKTRILASYSDHGYEIG